MEIATALATPPALNHALGARAVVLEGRFVETDPENIVPFNSLMIL
jgi:hypothetical protein